jgi:ligand-binding SRPBCC domain-containing protein
VDEQRVGPYRLWHHEHHFLPTDGGVEMRDRVTYSIEFGPVGEAAHSIWVKRQLDGVFEFRKGKVQEIFG